MCRTRRDKTVVTFILFAYILFFADLIGKTPRFCLYPCSTVRTFGIQIGAAFVICVAADFLIHDGADFVKIVSDCFFIVPFPFKVTSSICSVRRICRGQSSLFICRIYCCGGCSDFFNFHSNPCFKRKNTAKQIIVA